MTINVDQNRVLAAIEKSLRVERDAPQYVAKLELLAELQSIDCSLDFRNEEGKTPIMLVMATNDDLEDQLGWVRDAAGEDDPQSVLSINQRRTARALIEMGANPLLDQASFIELCDSIGLSGTLEMIEHMAAREDRSVSMRASDGSNLVQWLVEYQLNELDFILHVMGETLKDNQRFGQWIIETRPPTDGNLLHDIARSLGKRDGVGVADLFNGSEVKKLSVLRGLIEKSPVGPEHLLFPDSEGKSPADYIWDFCEKEHKWNLLESNSAKGFWEPIKAAQLEKTLDKATPQVERTTKPGMRL